MAEKKRNMQLIIELEERVDQLTELLGVMSNSLVRLHRKVIELEAVMAREGVGSSSIILPN